MAYVILNNPSALGDALRSIDMVHVSEQLMEYLQMVVIEKGMDESVALTYKTEVNGDVEHVQVVFIPSENEDAPEDGETNKNVQYVKYHSLNVLSQ